MSKELDDIKELRCLIYSCQENYIDNAEKVFLPILDRLEERLKALEIIEKKAVNVYIFLLSATLEEYNKTVSSFDWRQLAQEEYDLLKEVLL